MPRYCWTSLPSPVGSLVVAEAEGRPLVAEYALRTGRIRWVERLRERQGEVTLELGPCQATVSWLEAYFRGRPRPFLFPEYLADHLGASPAELAVWRELCRIPLGETRSYEQVAQATGLNPRLVGQLTGANHLAVLIPCHRVVGKRGGLVGYGGGLERKRWLLDHELRVTGLRLA